MGASVEKNQRLSHEREILINLSQECSADRRHHEMQCASVTHCVLLLAVAAIGVLKIDEATPWVNFLLALFVLGIGWFGYRLTRSSCANQQCQRTAGREYVQKLEKLLNRADSEVTASEPCSETIQKRSETIDTEDQTDRAASIMWSSVHVGIMALGVVLTVAPLSKLIETASNVVVLMGVFD